MSNPILQISSQTALVIDDDAFTQVIARRLLENLGITEIYQALNGLDGVRALDRMSGPPDFLICDIFMPDMDGIEFIGELSRRGYDGGLILVTGMNRDMLEVAAEIATLKGLHVLGTFTKPLQQLGLGLALGLVPRAEP